MNDSSISIVLIWSHLTLWPTVSLLVVFSAWFSSHQTNREKIYIFFLLIVATTFVVSHVQCVYMLIRVKIQSTRFVCSRTHREFDAKGKNEKFLMRASCLNYFNLIVFWFCCGYVNFRLSSLAMAVFRFVFYFFHFSLFFYNKKCGKFSRFLFSVSFISISIIFLSFTKKAWWVMIIYRWLLY